MYIHSRSRDRQQTVARSLRLTMAIHSLAGVPLMRGSSSRLAATVIIAAHNSETC